VGETRVDLLHLLEDLADAYPGSLEETVLTEIVANALDSGASLVRLIVDPTAATLTTIDDGRGMRRAELRKFHDVAASAKTKGEGIGFAGVGIKLGLLVSDDVVTETRRGKEHVCTTWALANRKRAPWHWIEPPGLVVEHGTAVRLKVREPLSPLLDPGWLEHALRHHFEPLFDPTFDGLLGLHYAQPVGFVINDRELSRASRGSSGRAEVAVRLSRHRRPAALGWLARHDVPLPEDRQGIAISTLGKVIKRGWDWLGLTPSQAASITGIIEAPALAGALTLNKADFLRAGARGAVYMTYRKALQQAVSEQLATWGDAHEVQQPSRRRATRPVERDVESVLLDLAEQFPMLAMLVERRSGGQRKLPVGVSSGMSGGTEPDLFTTGAIVTPEATPPDDEEAAAQAVEAAEAVSAPPSEEPAPPEPRETPGQPERPIIDIAASGGGRRKRRPTRLGLTIQFESRAEETDLGRLVETTVWVNDAHPAYRRAVESRSEGYHLALAVAMALAAVATESSQARAFVSEFLSRWGESGNGKHAKRRDRRSARRRGPRSE
jgi:Histidine kinase-, DNA gyrase B-, and HSP90-like ATPase